MKGNNGKGHTIESTRRVLGKTAVVEAPQIGTAPEDDTVTVVDENADTVTFLTDGGAAVAAEGESLWFLRPHAQEDGLEDCVNAGVVWLVENPVRHGLRYTVTVLCDMCDSEPGITRWSRDPADFEDAEHVIVIRA